MEVDLKPGCRRSWRRCHEPHRPARIPALRVRLRPRRRILHRQQRPRLLPVRRRPGPALRPGLSAARPPGGDRRQSPAARADLAPVGASGAARGGRDGRLQPGRTGRRALRGTRRPRRPRGLRARRGGGRGPARRGTAAPARGAVRSLAGRRRGVHRAGVGPGGRRGRRLVGLCAGRGGRLRRAGRARPAAARPAAALRHGVRPRRRRVRGDRPAVGRRRVAAPARRRGGRRAAVAGGGRHRRRLRVLVHGHAADRRGAGHALLRPHSRRGRLHRAARGNGLLRSRPGRRQRPRRGRGRPGSGGAEPCRGLSGCRRGSRGRRARGRRSSGSGRSRGAAPGARPG